MIKKSLSLFFLLVIIFSCSDEKKKEPTTAIGVARAFVRNILDNNFEDAERFLLNDDTNRPLFERFKTQYSNNDKAILEKYKNSDIIVNESANTADSVFLFKYITSYKKTDTTVLKLLRQDGKWLVDFKYTFSENQ
jgi:hypothetical protein